MAAPNEALRRAKDYIEVKKVFSKDPEGAILCLKERLIGLGQLIEIYKKETNKISISKEQKEICLLGIKDTIKTGKMITKWIRRLITDFPDHNFSKYEALMKILENEDLK